MKKSIFFFVLTLSSGMLAFLNLNSRKVSNVYEIYSNKTASLASPPSSNALVPSSLIYLFDTSYTQLMDVQDYADLHCPVGNGEICFVLLIYSFGWLQDPDGTPIVYYGHWVVD